MAMTAPSTPHRGLTWQQFLDLPEETHHAELLDGEVIVTTPSNLHQRVATSLIAHMKNWTWAATDRGEATMDPAVQITANTGYLPDIAWYRQDQCAPPGQPPAFDGPPTLVVEVLSPSTRAFVKVRKRNDYARIGVRELWLIDPEIPEALIVRATDHARTLADTATLDRDGDLCSPLLPGFAVRLGDLIER
jgi:Uma2 family endonuclease